MNKRIIVLFLFILVLVAGCSKSGNPISGGNGPDGLTDSTPIADTDILASVDGPFGSGDGKVILGAFQIVPDNETGLVKIVPYDDRMVMGHFNVNRFLKPPYCPIAQCWGYQIVDYDPINHVFLIDIMVYNPTSVTVYDTRVLFINLFDTDVDGDGKPITSNDVVLYNPDGWTKILDDEDLEPDMNPYILFNKEDYPYQIDDTHFYYPDRAFAGHTFDAERIIIKLPVQFEHPPVYLIEASWPGQAQEAIQYLFIDQRPPMDPNPPGFSFVTCGIFDHQGEDPNMHVYFSCPKVLGEDASHNPVEIEMQKWYVDPVTPAGRFFLSWIVKVNNVMNVNTIGEYPAMIRTVTPNPGDFDTYYKFPFKVRRNPGGSGHTDYESAIAFTSFENADADIYVADNVFLTRKFNATEEPDGLEVDPCWAKKGDKWFLYFASDVNYSQPGQDDYDIYLHIFQLDGTQMRRITGVPYLITAGNDGDDRAPCVSADLTFMVFQGQDGVSGDWEIWRGNFNMSDPTYFTGIPQNLTNNNANEENPTLNMFGTYMLFDSDALGGNSHDIFGMQPSLMSPVDYIIISDNDAREVAWNPYDPSYFIFTGQTGDPPQCDIWRARMTGIVVSEIINLTPGMGESDEKHASWSPSGQIIIFESNDGGDYELWAMDIDGDGRDQLTHNDFDELYPSWAQVP